MSVVEVVTAKVYRGGGRRYFSKASAYHGAARAMVRAKCECSRAIVCDAWGEPEDEVCLYCDRADIHRERLIKRLARWLKWHDSVVTQ